MQKVYTVYKTTNKVNGKYYIGVHRTSDPLDDYYGSGKILKRAIEKYGMENFEKEILAIFDTPGEAFQLEGELVTFDLIESKECYNLKEGGQGGFEYINKNGIISSIECRRNNGIKTSNLLKVKLQEDLEFRKKHLDNLATASKKGHATLKKKYPLGIMKDKHHSEETKIKIGKANSRFTGESNSQFGTCWITKDDNSKKIKKEELEIWLEFGWIKGRKISSKII